MTNDAWTQLNMLLKKSLSKKRFDHSVGVCDSAVQLAKHYVANVEKAALAGLLHDCARELPLPQLVELARQSGMNVDDQRFCGPNLLHAVAGARLACHQFGVRDPEVLQAIRFHTTGAAGMSVLDKIVFLADYIEPGRDFPGVEHLRKLATKDLDRAVLAGYDHTLLYLVRKRTWVHPLTIEGRNDVIGHVVNKKSVEKRPG